eukprot:2396994-Alexandrium_andersonii.AAC.1
MLAHQRRPTRLGADIARQEHGEGQPERPQLDALAVADEAEPVQRGLGDDDLLHGVGRYREARLLLSAAG